MITTNDNRTFNLDRIGATDRGKTHDDWVNSSSMWNNDHREISRAQQILMLAEKAAAGFEGTVKAMKKHKEITNPWALSHWMKGQGYSSHKKKSGANK